MEKLTLQRWEDFVALSEKQPGVTRLIRVNQSRMGYGDTEEIGEVVIIKKLSGVQWSAERNGPKVGKKVRIGRFAHQRENQCQ